MVPRPVVECERNQVWPEMRIGVNYTNEAISKDHDERYEEAIPLYKKALENLLYCLNHRAMTELFKNQIRAKCKEISNREQKLMKFLEDETTVANNRRLGCRGSSY